MIAEPNPIDRHVGNRIRARRLHLNITQTQMADRLGVTFQQVQKYERGVNRVSASRLFEIGRVLDVPMSYFFQGLSGETDGLPEERVMTAFAATFGGQEVAKTYVGLSPEDRMTILTIIRAFTKHG